MSVQITMQGTVKADGTLELDDPVAMPEGRGLVTVRPIVEPAPNDPFWQRMEQIWAGQRARGHVPRTKEEIDAEIESMGDEMEEEFQATEHLQEECRRAREQANPAEESNQ
jgi:hypothetical protein